MGKFFALNTGPCPAQKISGPGIFLPEPLTNFQKSLTKAFSWEKVPQWAHWGG